MIGNTKVENIQGALATQTSSTMVSGATTAYIIAPASTAAVPGSTSTSLVSRNIEESAFGRLMIRPFQWIGLLEQPEVVEESDPFWDEELMAADKGIAGYGQEEEYDDGYLTGLVRRGLRRIGLLQESDM